MTTIIGGKLMEIDKSAFQNVMKHTDTHNRLKEMDEMWKQHEKEKEVEIEDTRDRRCKNITKKLYTGRLHSDHMGKETSGFWTKKLMEFEEKDPDRWGHTGFKELYPEEFGSNEPTQENPSKKENESEAKINAEHSKPFDRDRPTQRDQRNRPDRNSERPRFENENRRRRFAPMRGIRREQGFGSQQNRYRSRSRDRNRPSYQEEHDEGRRRLPGRYDRRNARERNNLQQSDESMSENDKEKSSKQIRSQVGKVNQIKEEKGRGPIGRGPVEDNGSRRRDSPHKRDQRSGSNERERNRRNKERRIGAHEERRSRDKSHEKKVDNYHKEHSKNDKKIEVEGSSKPQKIHSKQFLANEVNDIEKVGTNEPEETLNDDMKKLNEHAAVEQDVTVDAFGRDISKRRNYRKNRSSSSTKDNYSAANGWKLGERKANFDVYSTKDLVDRKLETDRENLMSSKDKGASIVSIDYDKLDYDEEESRNTAEIETSNNNNVDSFHDGITQDNSKVEGEGNKKQKKERKSKKKREKKKKKRMKKRDKSPDTSEDDAEIGEDRMTTDQTDDRLKDQPQLYSFKELKDGKENQLFRNEAPSVIQDQSSLIGNNRLIELKDVELAEDKLQEASDGFEQVLDDAMGVEFEIRNRIKRKMKEREITDLQKKLLNRAGKFEDEEAHKERQRGNVDSADERKTQRREKTEKVILTRHRRTSSSNIDESEPDRMKEDVKDDRKKGFVARSSHSNSREHQRYRNRNADENRKEFTRGRRRKSSTTEESGSSLERSKSRKNESRKSKETYERDSAKKKRVARKKSKESSTSTDSKSSDEDTDDRRPVKNRRNEVQKRTDHKVKTWTSTQRSVPEDSDNSSDSSVSKEESKKNKLKQISKRKDLQSRGKHGKLSESSAERKKRKIKKDQKDIKRSTVRNKDSDTDDYFDAGKSKQREVNEDFRQRKYRKRSESSEDDTEDGTEKKTSKNNLEKRKYKRFSEDRLENDSRSKKLNSPKRIVKKAVRKKSMSTSEISDEERSAHHKSKDTKMERRKQNWEVDEKLKRHEKKRDAKGAKESSKSSSSSCETDSDGLARPSGSRKMKDQRRNLKDEGHDVVFDKKVENTVSKRKYKDDIANKRNIKKSEDVQKYSNTLTKNPDSYIVDQHEMHKHHSADNDADNVKHASFKARRQDRRAAEVKGGFAAEKAQSSSSEFSLYDDIDLHDIKVEKKQISHSQEKRTEGGSKQRRQPSEYDSDNEFNISHQESSRSKKRQGRGNTDRADFHNRRRSRSQRKTTSGDRRRSPAHYHHKRRHSTSDSGSDRRKAKHSGQKRRHTRRDSPETSDSDRSSRWKNKKIEKGTKPRRRPSSHSDSSWSSDSDRSYDKRRRNRKRS